MPDLSPRAYRFGFGAVLLAAALAGFVRLDVPPLWLDEASSWHNVSGTWLHLWQRAVAGEDSGGLLYSIVLKLWIALAGTGEGALRTPGVLLWLATIATVASAAHRAWGRRDAAVYAASATLAHPSVLAAARQARSYILLIALTAVALLALAEVQAGRRRRGLGILAAASLAAAAAHVMGVFVAAGAALCQALLDRRERRGLVPAALAITPAVLFAAVWTVLIRGRVQQNLASFWIPGTLVSNYLAIGALLVAPLVLASVWVLWRDRSPRARTFVAGLTVFALPIALGPAIVSAFAAEGRHLVQLRYALPLAVLGTAATGCALATLPRRLATVIVFVALAATAPYSASKQVYSPVSRAGQDIRRAASFLASTVTPGDLLLVEPPNNWMALAYYGVETVPAEGYAGGWRVAGTNGKGKREKAKGKRQNEAGKRPEAEATTWLVRFSQRTAAPPDLLAHAVLMGRFGTLTILRVPSR